MGWFHDTVVHHRQTWDRIKTNKQGNNDWKFVVFIACHVYFISHMFTHVLYLLCLFGPLELSSLLSMLILFHCIDITSLWQLTRYGLLWWGFYWCSSLFLNVYSELFSFHPFILPAISLRSEVLMNCVIYQAVIMYSSCTSVLIQML